MSGATGSTVAVVVGRDVVRVTGDDAADYLQGQISQDVESLGVGAVAWSLVLEPTGKLAGWFRVHRLGPAEFLLDTESGAGEALRARLERFRLRTDVEFTSEQGWRMLSIRGEVPERLPDHGIVVPFEWPGFSGVDVLAPDALDEAGLPAPLDPDGFERARIRAGVPRMGVDIDADTIPAEAGEPVVGQAVSFTKGCYTGQELVARIDSRGGQVPRPLRVVAVAAPVRAGVVVTHDGDEVGRVTSSIDDVALGPVMRKVPVGASVEVGGVAGRIAEPVGDDGSFADADL